MSREQVGIRFSAEDRELAEALRKKLGIRTRSDVVRLGLRRLAVSEGLAWPSDAYASPRAAALPPPRAPTGTEKP